MKKSLFALIILGLLVTSKFAIAYVIPQPVQPVGTYPRLNKVSYQIMKEQWVNTKTALVTVKVSANLGQSNLTDLQQRINEHLQKLGGKTPWHMSRFDRSQDSSGLERILISAQARLPQAQLADIRAKAKAISKPGMKYEIKNIAYTPTIAESQQVLDQLRQDIYKKVQQEITLLDQTYGGQQFYVNQIQFITSGVMPVTPRTAMVRLKAMPAGSSQGEAQANVSKKVVLVANVTLASTISAGNKSS